MGREWSEGRKRGGEGEEEDGTGKGKGGGEGKGDVEDPLLWILDTPLFQSVCRTVNYLM